jgi:hypothetical protein
MLLGEKGFVQTWVLVLDLWKLNLLVGTELAPTRNQWSKSLYKLQSTGQLGVPPPSSSHSSHSTQALSSLLLSRPTKALKAHDGQAASIAAQPLVIPFIRGSHQKAHQLFNVLVRALDGGLP